MPCLGQPSTPSDGGIPPERRGHHCSLITRATPGCRATGGVEVETASLPPREQPDVIRAEESASPVRNSFYDWTLLQKALTFQRSAPGEELLESGHPKCRKSGHQ
ncbi:uncharacterized protein LOC142788353 [Rhipicephalus microplus]|uniref:uncharacterized protein LOC142788353 n=1 Tax=Rhipicephalus microplus TaxID=6941 RepID=UPI003F6B004B